MMHHTENSVAAPIDVSTLVLLRQMRTPGQPDPALELCAVFLQDADDRLTALRRAVEGADAAGMRAAAHSLKGMSGAIGAVRMSELSDTIEHHPTAGDAAGLMAALDEEFSRVRQAITDFL